jgi:hypothetical protein
MFFVFPTEVKNHRNFESVLFVLLCRMNFTLISFLILFVSVILTSSIQISFVDLEDIENVSFVEEEKEEDTTVDNFDNVCDYNHFSIELANGEYSATKKRTLVHHDRTYASVDLGVPYSPPEIS